MIYVKVTSFKYKKSTINFFFFARGGRFFKKLFSFSRSILIVKLQYLRHPLVTVLLPWTFLHLLLSCYLFPKSHDSRKCGLSLVTSHQLFPVGLSTNVWKFLSGSGIHIVPRTPWPYLRVDVLDLWGLSSFLCSSFSCLCVSSLWSFSFTEGGWRAYFFVVFFFLFGRWGPQPREIFMLTTRIQTWYAQENLYILKYEYLKMSEVWVAVWQHTEKREWSIVEKSRSLWTKAWKNKK